MDPEKYKYYLGLFITAFKNDGVHVNTLYRLIYIYLVAEKYLYEGRNFYENEILLDERTGIADKENITKGLNILKINDLITENNNTIKPSEALIDKIKKSESDRVKKDFNKIMFFVRALKIFTDDEILEIFYKEPNINESYSRNIETIKLSNNKLIRVLKEIKEKYDEDNKADSYDVFVFWLNKIINDYYDAKFTATKNGQN